MALPNPGSDERAAEEIRQLDILLSYTKIFEEDVKSIKIRIKMQGALNLNDRLRLRGVVAEFNLMFRNFYEPVIINRMEME